MVLSRWNQFFSILWYFLWIFRCLLLALALIENAAKTLLAPSSCFTRALIRAFKVGQHKHTHRHHHPTPHTDTDYWYWLGLHTHTHRAKMGRSGKRESVAWPVSWCHCQDANVRPVARCAIDKLMINENFLSAASVLRRDVSRSARTCCFGSFV